MMMRVCSTTLRSVWKRHAPQRSLAVLTKAARGIPSGLGSGIGTDSSMIAANHRSPFSTASIMQDEYEDMNDDGHTFEYEGPYVLENGQVLPEAQLRYQTYGTLNEARDNVIVVCHALTGNASLHSWWGDLLGPDKAFDTSKYFIVCCNILGSCYGSTSPMSVDPFTNQIYGTDFPDVSVQDTVRLQLIMLQEHLEISSIKCVIGGSFGGMQAIEYAVQGGSEHADFVSHDGSPLVRSVIPIACGAHHTAWQIAISEVQRQAVYADPYWSIDPIKATSGLSVARQVGMVSYRTPHGYQSKFARNLQTSSHQDEDAPLYGSPATFQVKSYLEYQGRKFLSRFDPITYVKLTEQMDSHDISRNRSENIETTLNKVDIPCMVLGIDSDVLYPLSEQEELAAHVPQGQLEVIKSMDGHDGFLLEQHQVAHYIHQFLEEQD